MSDDVVVVTEEEVIVVTGGPGPQGPAGPAGPAGAVSTYTHAQASASATWTINHALGYKPAGIYVEDTAGDEMIAGDRNDPTVNQTVLTFSAAVSGFVILN